MSTSGWGAPPVRLWMGPLKAAYLDNQASTPLDPRVREVMLEAWSAPGNPSSEEHAFGWDQARRVALAQEQVAALVGSHADEVTFTSGATESNNIAVIGGALAAPAFRRRILVSAIEHKSVLEAAYSCERQGFVVETVGVDRSGVVSIDELSKRVAPDVAVVSIMAVNNEIGTVQPTAALSEVARRAGALFHVDATQAPAAERIDLFDWNADVLSLSAHKIYGPNGIGAIVVSQSAQWSPQPLFFGGGQQNGLRPGTLPAALCAGFGEACRLMIEEGETERQKIRAKRDLLWQVLAQSVPEMRITCEGTARHPGNLHVRIPGVSAADLLMRLQPDVAASSGSACTSGVIGASHVMLALGVSEDEASECLRFSVGRFTTVEEIEFSAGTIASALVRMAA